MKKFFSIVMALMLGFSFANAEATRIYCKATQGWWTDGGAAVGIYTWDDGGTAKAAWPGERMAPVEGEEGVWYVDLDLSVYKMCIFTRVNASGAIADWGAKTADLTIPTDGKNLYTITSTSAVWGDPGAAGEWSTHGGEEAEYLLLGSAPSMGAWQGDGAAKFVNGLAEVTVPAGDCEFKVVPSDWNWDNALGYAAVDAGCSSEGISEGDNGNIKITLSEAGTLRVELKDGKLCVTFSAGAGENPQPTDKEYLLFGSAPSMGAWQGDGAAKFVNGVAEVTVPAGDCEFKVVPSDWNWDNALGFAAVDAGCSSEGISEGDNGNVKITLSEEGTLRVEIKDGKLCVTFSAGAGENPQPTDKDYYLIGSAEAIGGTSWDGTKAVKLVDGVAEVTIPAGECQFKVVPAEGANWDWNHALGAADVNAECSSDGIKSGDNGNVKIEMAAEGKLRVEIKNGKLCVTGNFVAGSEPELTNGYYLIGLTGWDLSAINPVHKFAASEEVEGEFVLTVTLAEGNTIKVVEVENDIIKAWFPEGMGTEYTVDADHIGERKIFFRPAGNPEWANFGGFIFISEEQTALDNTSADVKAVKFILNGQLFIRANGSVFDVMGQSVR